MLKKNKPYKAKEPFETVNQIRGILAECDIFTTETPCNYSDEKLYSCLVHINDGKLSPDFIRYGTNGKGLTPRFSLASAYGEFIERIQLGYLLSLPQIPVKGTENSIFGDSKYFEYLDKNDLYLDFHHAPDEKYFSPGEIINTHYDIFKEAFNSNEGTMLRYLNISIDHKNKNVCVPYYNVQEKKVEYLPWRFILHLCNSTGMCAGNTPEEALIQGICEVFERYVIKKIYFDHVNPPDIPIEVFKDTEIYDKLYYLMYHKNLSFKIKDCSLGKGLPVIGLLMIDRNNYKYTFKLGSDPSPITALERCISEIYQRGYEKKLQPIHFGMNGSVSEMNGNELNYWIDNYKKTIYKGYGKWPEHIFNAKFSYKFKGLRMLGKENDKKDLSDLLEIIKTLGKKIYIRDWSYLDFSTFHIYIPGMSESYETFEQNIAYFERFIKHKPVINRIQSENDQKIKEFAYSYDSLYQDKYPDIPYIQYRYISPKILKVLPVELILSLLFYKLEEYNRAVSYLKLYIRKYDIKTPKIICLRDLMILKSEKTTIEQIKSYLSLWHGDELAKLTINTYFDPSKITKFFNFPTCFNCKDCKYSHACGYFEILRLIKIQHSKYKQNVIDQNRLAALFTA
jgi:ribosomal protein S12 methylthiotransferase accessory factor